MITMVRTRLTNSTITHNLSGDDWRKGKESNLKAGRRPDFWVQLRQLWNQHPPWAILRCFPSPQLPVPMAPTHELALCGVLLSAQNMIKPPPALNDISNTKFPYSFVIYILWKLIIFTIYTINMNKLNLAWISILVTFVTRRMTYEI